MLIDKYFLSKRLEKLRYIYLFLVCICCIMMFGSSAWGIVCLDEACVGCHVVPTTAVNIALTHPNLIVGCITCHSPECLPGIHKDGIRQLDPAFYNFTGTAANIGCNVCHGAPPQALCVGGLVMDHCLDPSGCNPTIFNCIECHPNFNGTPAHIYPKILGAPFAPVASIAKCLACHGLSLFVGRSGAHGTHFITKLMLPPTTSSFGVSIGCAVCHPDLTVNLGPDHLVCLPGTSNAWLPGKVPVAFDPLLPQIGLGDFYAPGPLGGTGSCVVYCHSNGQTPPLTALSLVIGYPGSPLPVPWNIPFPVDPITLDCGCCHAFPPLTHTATKTDCNQCHPTPVLGIAPTSTYHINGIPDLWKFLAAASPMVPLILPDTPSPSINDIILTTGSGINKFLGLPGSGLSAFNTYDSGMALLSAFGMINAFNPVLAVPLVNNLSMQGLTIANEPGLLPGFQYPPNLMPAYYSRVFGLPGSFISNPASPFSTPSLAGFSTLSNVGNYYQPYHLPFIFSLPNFSGVPVNMNLMNPIFPFGGFGQPFYW